MRARVKASPLGDGPGLARELEAAFRTIWTQWCQKQGAQKGESLNATFEQAIAAFSQVIQSYPKSDQVPWAYYRRGLAQRALRQTPAARASFEAVVKQFPESEPAVLALSQLQSLDTPAPATQPRRP